MADELRCPSCGAKVTAGSMRTYSADGPPDAVGYQCAGVEGEAPCSWFVVWPNGNAPLTNFMLSMGVRS